MLRVQPIYGSYGHGSQTTTSALPPSCTYLEFSGISLLVDMGIDESLSDENPIFDKIVSDYLPKVEGVLVCDSTLCSIGALPLVLSKKLSYSNAAASASPKAYGTFPTAKMGQMTLYDYHANASLDGQNLSWDLDDVDTVFGKSFVTLKYSQVLTLKNRQGEDAVTITPHRAGRVVGAAFWVLQSLKDETEVVIALNYNHAKERHLDSSQLQKFAAAADVLITRPGGPGGELSLLYKPSPSNNNKPALAAVPWTKRESELIDFVMSALRRGGNVLLPVDASGRVLELLLLLSSHWARQRLGTAYVLCWVGAMSKNTANYARSQLEWMAEPLGKQFDSMHGHPYGLKNVHICSSINELQIVERESKGLPMAVLASGASLEAGPARDLLLKWADNSDNTIILTDSTRCTARSCSSEQASTSKSNSLSAAAQLLSKWCEAKAVGEEMSDSIEVEVLVQKREALTGSALKAFLADEEIARQEKKEAAVKKALLKEVELAKGKLRLGEDVEEVGVDNTTSSAVRTVKFENPSLTQQPPKKKSRFDSTLFLKFSKPNYMMLDAIEEAVGLSQVDRIGTGVVDSFERAHVIEDDYGIEIDPDFFHDIVTGIDHSKVGTRKIGANITGLGFGVNGRPLMTPLGGGAMGLGKDERRSGADGMMNSSQAVLEDESVLEAQDLSRGNIIRGRNGKPPMKVFTTNMLLEVLAEIVYIPLEARANARAARQIVRSLQPRELVIIGGGDQPGKISTMIIDENVEQSEAQLLAEVVREQKSSKNDHNETIHVPNDGDLVELEVGHSAYAVRLIDTSSKDSNNYQDGSTETDESVLGDYSVQYIDRIATGQRVAQDGSIVLAPRRVVSPSNNSLLNSNERKTGNIMLSSGDVLLTDIRANLVALGMKAFYSTKAGHQYLDVNGRIFLSRNKETGKIDIEGPLCEDFFTVRSIVCSQYVTI